jgi:REP element-mobilizing transposase RayT
MDFASLDLEVAITESSYTAEVLLYVFQFQKHESGLVYQGVTLRKWNARCHQRLVRYFVTFSCYGARFHGDEEGSVDREHNMYGERLVESSPDRVAREREWMVSEAYLMDARRRDVVLNALCRHGSYRGWSLLAAHVRSNHVHVVVDAEVTPERVMNELKAYASRALNGVEGKRKRWARHGSTRRLFRDIDVAEVIRYVVEGQGEAMSVFVEREWFAG